MEEKIEGTQKELKLIIQPKVIDHLGIKMYQKPVDVISEFVANSWDADSEIVEILIKDGNIKITDRGVGMNFSQCQDFFLTVGRDRRKDTGKEVSEEKGRPILGRKGIGKFSGFGIAKTIEITTISKANGELTSFEMDIVEILEYDVKDNPNKPIKVLNYQKPDPERTKNYGTIVTLKGLDTSSIDIDIFKEELARRFLLTQIADDFTITVNGNTLPDNFSKELEFVFPRDLSKEDKIKIINQTGTDEKGWAIETFQTYEIKWRIGFYEEPIETEELRGISIFAKGKMAQKPFFFDIAGGISGQMGLEYITGQVIMDFIDTGSNDLIATERQRINLQGELGKHIKEWGIERIKLLSSIWKQRRSEKRLQELEEKLGEFKERLGNLPASERAVVRSVLLKIASFERLGQKRFKDWCNDILNFWEKGRLRELITQISQTPNIDEMKLLEMLSEADFLTALNIAESVKTKILAIGELKQRINHKQLENKVRDYIYEHPWIIHPKWESFKKERGVENIIKDSGVKNLNYEPFNGRVDMALSSGSNLLLVEFLRPGVPIDRDHLDRINYYVMDIRDALHKETGNTLRTVETAYVIGDNFKDINAIRERISQLERDHILVLTWDGLISQALKQWEDYLDLLKDRNPNDKRIQDL
jgi:hypothetical protein